MQPPPLRLLLAAGALLGAVYLALPAGERGAQPLRVIWPEAGGDGALVLAPDGSSVLIDGGSDAAALASWLGDELPFGRRRIDVVVLTRADRATLPGQLAALRRYAVGAALYPGFGEPSADLDAWRRLLDERGVEPRLMRSGDSFPTGACRLDVPAVAGERAAVVVRCGQSDAWFLQSLDDRLERELAAGTPHPAALLVWPWRRPTDAALPRSLRPAALLFAEGSAGDGVLSWNSRRIGGARLLHEQLHGRIELAAAGGGVAIRTQREP